jgi:hypothetical protein
MVNIAGFNISFAPCAGPRDQVGTARGVDNHFGQNRVSAFFAFKDGTADDPVLDHQRRAPGV